MDTRYTPWLNLCFLIIFLSLNFHISLSSDRITGTQSLSGDQTIVSKGGTFKLGFFKPSNASKYYYIGIWYNQLPQQTIVWVANREKPVFDKFSSAFVISNGNLVLLNESHIPIWSTEFNQILVGSTNSSSKSNSVEAVLLDNGNFILNGSVSKEPLWQSFDNPTDTLLPGAEFGGSSQLISWRGKEDPAPGQFSLELNSNETGNYFIVRPNHYPSSTNTALSSVFEMALNYGNVYDFSYVVNSNKQYFTYSLYNHSIISRFVMDVEGEFQLLSWLESANQWKLFWSQRTVLCNLYDYCGSFGHCSTNSQPFCHCLTGFHPQSVNDWNSGVYWDGCVRKTPRQCGTYGGKKDGFLAVYNMRLSAIPYADVMAVESIQECEGNCSNNCNCTAYAYDINRCWIWNRDLVNVQQLADGDPSAKALYIRLAASEFLNHKKMLIEAVSGSMAVIVVVVGLVTLLIFRKKRSKMSREVELTLTAFGYGDLKDATKNFSEKLGSGGFGSVFKGTLPDSSVIAVKKLECIGEGEKQFCSEINILGMIQHVNLVRLVGFCFEETIKMLVYDYIPNGSLDSHIFRDKVLDWKTRYNVALGTARGLAYLHEECKDCIIHCDIKPENILLDAEFSPKVADFGLAKLLGGKFSIVLTSVRGTRGYLAPEWLSGETITSKVDIYSYGMMLFELVSGRRNSEKPEDRTVKYFPIWVGKQISEGGDILRLLDPKLGGVADLDELTRVCKVACWCIQDDESQRPSMRQVVRILEGVQNVNGQPPIPKSLADFFDDEEHIFIFAESSTTQNLQLQSQTQSSSKSMPSSHSNDST